MLKVSKKTQACAQQRIRAYLSLSTYRCVLKNYQQVEMPTASFNPLSRALLHNWFEIESEGTTLTTEFVAQV